MTNGLFPASHAPTTVVMPHPLAASTPAKTSTPDLSGVIDGVSAHVAVIPSGDLQSGIIVKAGGPTWGGMAAGGDPDYGKGQFISFHKWNSDGLLGDPNDTLMFRVDKTGGLGLTGGMHVATGLRQDVGYSVTQAVWINPNLNTTHVAMTGTAGQTLPFIYCSDSVGGMLFEVFPNGGVESAGDFAARFGTDQQVAIGNVAGFASINFGDDNTTFLARTSVSTYLQVTNHLQAVGELIAEVGQTDKQVVIGSQFGTYAGISFGTAVDTVMWRAFPGFISCSDNFHVKNLSHPATAVLTLQNAAAQTGKAVRGLDSTGAEIWSIDASGVLSTVGGGFPPSSGNWTMHDSLVVQNNGATATTVLSAIGVSGQSGYLIAAVQNTGGVVWSVTNAGVVAAASSITAGGAVTGKSGQFTATSSGTVALAAVGVAGQSVNLISAVQSTGGTVFGVTNAGAVSAASTVTCTAVSATGGTSFFAAISVSSVASSGGLQGTTLSLSGSITGATTISASSTVTCTAVSATGGTSFFAAISVSSVASSGGVQATSFTASSSSSSLRGINNNGLGISSAGALSGVTTLSMSGNLGVSGTSFLSAVACTSLNCSPGPKTFVIDHPLKAEYKLVHACIEGPENAVYYRGESQLGHDGTTVVQLPDYFEALTAKDGRTVQLTVIHDDAPAHPLSATAPADGSFMVVGHPGARFWWHVTAVRGDIDPLEVEPPASSFPSPEFDVPQFDDAQLRQDQHDELAGMAAWDDAE